MNLSAFSILLVVAVSLVLSPRNAWSQDTNGVEPLPPALQSAQPFFMSRVKIDGDELQLEVQVPITETVEQTYTVEVPYTEEINGKTVNKKRQETRTRTINVTRFVIETQSAQLMGFEFSTLTGEKVRDSAKLRKHLAEMRPALMMAGTEPLPEYYRPFFADGIVVIHRKAENGGEALQDK